MLENSRVKKEKIRKRRAEQRREEDGFEHQNIYIFLVKLSVSKRMNQTKPNKWKRKEKKKQIKFP